jgi:hypothetical protein
MEAPTGTWSAPRPGDSRGPCPALNSLANEGRLPRDGRVTEAQLVDAMQRRLGIPPVLGARLAKLAVGRLGTRGPDGVKVLSLLDLGLHGFIEHDASLSRRDAREGNAVEVVPALVDQLTAQSSDGRMLTLEDITVVHQLRVAQSSGGVRDVPLKAELLGTLEAALLYQVLGQGGNVAVSDAVTLLREERIPRHISPRPIGIGALLATAAAIAVMGNVPTTRAAQRAREAAARIPEPRAASHPAPGDGPARCPFAGAGEG